MRAMSWPDRWLIGTGATVAVLAVVSVLVALAAGGSGDPLPEDSPEGAVQRYLQAVERGDYAAAHALLGGELRGECGVEELRDQSRWQRDSEERVILVGTEELGEQTVVTVSVSQVRSDGLFTVGESSYQRDYYLERQDGAWRFASLPWPLGHCEGRDDAAAVEPRTADG